jgi:hypothetical protein
MDIHIPQSMNDHIPSTLSSNQTHPQMREITRTRSGAGKSATCGIAVTGSRRRVWGTANPIRRSFAASEHHSWSWSWSQQAWSQEAGCIFLSSSRLFDTAIVQRGKKEAIGRSGGDFAGSLPLRRRVWCRREMG